MALRNSRRGLREVRASPRKHVNYRQARLTCEYDNKRTLNTWINGCGVHIAMAFTTAPLFRTTWPASA